MINTKSSASVILITAMLLIVGYLSMTTGLSSAPIFTQQSDLATSTAPTNVAPTTVSYTHLDVYKRQVLVSAASFMNWPTLSFRSR